MLKTHSKHFPTCFNRFPHISGTFQRPVKGLALAACYNRSKVSQNSAEVSSLNDDDYKSFLSKLHRNLNILKEREAKYGGNPPLELLNQIEDHQTAIALTEQAMRGELSEARWREAIAPLNLSLAQTTNVFQVFIQSLPRPLIIGLGVLLVVILGVGIVNLGPVQQTLFPTPTPTVTPLPFAPASENETLILIATFHHTEGVADSDAHNEIRRAIEAAVDELSVTSLRVEVEPTRLIGEDQDEARKLGERYGASMVIWGADTGVRITVNFLNLKEPDYAAAAVKISETERTQLANPKAYARFITTDLPGQLTFLALYAVGRSYYIQADYSQAIQVIEKAVAAFPPQLTLPQGAAEAYFRLGWLYQEQTQYDPAVVAYTRAIELNYDPLASPYNNRGLAYYNQSDYERAITDYKKAIELDPKSVFAYTNRGWTYYKQGDYERAIADYNKAIELDPKNALAYNNRGTAYHDQGDYERAIADYNKAIELNHDPLSWPYTNRGNAYADQGDYEQAIADYTKAIELDPKYAPAYNNRGTAYHDQGDYERAITDYNKAIELDPKYAFAYNNRGTAYYNQGDYERAIADYNKAIELDPKYAFAYTNRGNAYYNQGDYERAITDYTKAIELDPKNAAAHYNRGNAYADQGDYERAIADYTKAIELDPNHARAYNNRGTAYADQGDYERAIADYNKAIELNHDPLSWPYTNRGNAYADQGDYEQATADYTKAIELNPQDVDTWNNLCWTGSLAGVAAEVLDACEQAVKLAPDDGWKYDNRGLARALTGDYQGAIEDFKFFVEWSKQNDLYEQYGHKREAWIAELEAGHNPFDEATLEALRKE